MHNDQKPTAWLTLHGVLLFLAMFLLPLALPAMPRPGYWLLPLSLYAIVAFLIPPLRQNLPLLAVGRLGALPTVATLTLAAATAGVLLTYQQMARPNLTVLANRLPATMLGSVLLAGVVFSVANAVWEELVFRGVLFEATAADWGMVGAIGATTVLFGIGHLNGYPPGPLGAVLAGVFGLTLGLLRWWCGGLRLAVACHVVADAIIFWIVTSTRS